MNTSIAVEMTPHPDIERFVFPQALVQKGPYRFRPESDLSQSLLAQKILKISAVAEVLIAENYIQITRTPNADWLTLEETLETLLYEYLNSGLSLFQEELDPILPPDPLIEPLLPIESTPNPQTKKILVPSSLVSAPQEFLNPSQTQHSPLAKSLFEIAGIRTLLIAPYHVSITKKETAEWPPIESRASAILMQHFQSGGTTNSEPQRETVLESGSLMQQIQEFLSKEIRPGIVLDGGDVVLLGYQDGVVSLQLQGACRGCPHSAKTLNQGIERRLKAAFAEVQYVVIGTPTEAHS